MENQKRTETGEVVLNIANKISELVCEKNARILENANWFKKETDLCFKNILHYKLILKKMRAEKNCTKRQRQSQSKRLRQWKRRLDDAYSITSYLDFKIDELKKLRSDGFSKFYYKFVNTGTINCSGAIVDTGYLVAVGY